MRNLNNDFQIKLLEKKVAELEEKYKEECKKLAAIPSYSGFYDKTKKEVMKAEKAFKGAQNRLMRLTGRHPDRHSDNGK